jgi:hypothetical protein
MKSIEAKNPGLQAKLLRGEDSDTAPGFRDLAEYGIGESLDRFNSSWSVRCETIRFLFNMFQEKSLEENVWQFMLFIIATKLTNRKEHKEEHKLVSSFLRYILGEMKSQYSRKESRPRINHFLGEVKGKIKLEKGVSEALDSLRRKKESLRTILTDQTEELGNKEKDLAQIPAIVPGQQKAGTNESTEEKKAREDREKLEKEIQSLKTTIDQQATSLEDTQAQEELLSLLQLEGTPTHD